MKLLAAGRDADVYALDANRVLRRYRRGGDAAVEAAVMGHVARHAFPVPEVFQAKGPNLVMERLSGRTLQAALRAGDAEPGLAGRLLADLHARLHRVPGRQGDKAQRVLHLDLRPETVVLTPKGPVVVDWTRAGEGLPDLDVAVTAVALGQVAVGGQAGDAALARAVLPVFLAAAGGNAVRLVEQAVAIRGADPNLTVRESVDLSEAAALVRRT
ncbi:MULTISPECIES: phosphotransferase [Actinosynnema]|uniref:phosphotransferase n=1 Tax=Actinosynnema TaxID=40566 RepID=UPI0020A4D69E|nr:phosphotransferase [Actinosynnema pretiosum]MCP2098254.1 Phosphotransferase enzyme family protein [Actinosynnema pretiosum]